MKPNYYLIGSKYGDNSDKKDIFPQMVEKSVVSVRFAWNYDLSKLFEKEETEIIKYLSEKGEDSPSYSTLKLFLNLKEGDLIAIKKSGSPVGKKSRLVICGYAVVKQINGKIYEYDPKSLGHLVYVDFLDDKINRELELGYAKTLHKLTRADRIKKIFGSYYEPYLTAKSSNGVTTKNTNSHTRTINASYVVENVHNKMQQNLYDKLVKKYGADSVTMEKNYVDIKLIEKNKITFFEVKHSNSAIGCIRSGLGQVLDYLWKDENANADNSKIVIVGHQQPTNTEINYINFLKDNLDIEFEYLGLN